MPAQFVEDACLPPLYHFICFVESLVIERGQPCLVPDFRGIALSISPFGLMLADCLLYIALIMFRYVLVILSLQDLFHERVLNFVEGFSASKEMII